MTYFGFLLRFLFIPILILIAIHYLLPLPDRERAGVRVNRRAVWIAIFAHVIIAVAYTTPWDNYLVATGVWYYNPDLVTGIVIGYVPIEEYTFFVVETILAGLWWWFLARRISLTPNPSPSGRGGFTVEDAIQDTGLPSPSGRGGFTVEDAIQDTGLPSPSGKGGFTPNKRLIYVSASVLVIVWAISTYLFFFGDVKWTYLSIILFWALPPILPQLLFGADILWHYRKLVFWAIMVPGTYLSLMDILALEDTTWSISPTQTTGVLFFGILPLEEVVFFFITNVLITFGMTLLLANVSQRRVTEIKEQLQSWREAGLRLQKR